MDPQQPGREGKQEVRPAPTTNAGASFGKQVKKRLSLQHAVKKFKGFQFDIDADIYNTLFCTT